MTATKGHLRDARLVLRRLRKMFATESAGFGDRVRERETGFPATIKHGGPAFVWMTPPPQAVDVLMAQAESRARDGRKKEIRRAHA